MVEDDDAGVAEAGIADNFRGGLKSVDAGHADVHEHDVGDELAGEPSRGLALGRFAHDLEVGLRLEQRANPARTSA